MQAASARQCEVVQKNQTTERYYLIIDFYSNNVKLRRPKYWGFSANK